MALHYCDSVFLTREETSPIDKRAPKVMFELRQSEDDFRPNDNRWPRSPDDPNRFFGDAHFASHNQICGDSSGAARITDLAVNVNDPRLTVFADDSTHYAHFPHGR